MRTREPCFCLPTWGWQVCSTVALRWNSSLWVCKVNASSVELCLQHASANIIRALTPYPSLVLAKCISYLDGQCWQCLWYSPGQGWAQAHNLSSLRSEDSCSSCLFPSQESTWPHGAAAIIRAHENKQTLDAYVEGVSRAWSLAISSSCW